MAASAAVQVFAAESAPAGRPRREEPFMKTCCRWYLSAVAIVAVVTGAARGIQPEPVPKVTAVPEELRKDFKLDPFYQKYTDYKGFAILSSAKVSDEGVLEA